MIGLKEFQSLIIKGNRFLRAQGLLKTIYWIGYGYLKVQKFRIFRKSLRNIILKNLDDNSYTIKKLSIKDLINYRQNKMLPMNFYCDQFDGAEHCFVACAGDHIAHILWIYLEDEPSRFFIKKTGQAEINYALTTKGNSGHNLYSKVLKYAFIWLADNGYTEVLAATNVKNIPAIQSIIKSGMTHSSNFTQYGPFRTKKRLK